MAKRQYIITHDSSDIQGEGSHVKMRQLTWKRQKQLRREQAELTQQKEATEGTLAKLAIDEELEEMAFGMVAEHIVEWNWVDEHGNLLFLPKDDDEVMEQLTIQEINWLTRKLMGQDEADPKKLG